MRFATKAEWAEAKADEIEQQIQKMREEPRIPSSQWQRVRRRMEVMSNLRTQRSKFLSLAERFRQRGE